MSLRRPLVSIGLPIYNGAVYVAQALDSLCAQDYQNWELTISDNASTDATSTICNEYAEHDSRPRVVRHRFIVPEISWIATSAPISYVGATPVFADIDPLTWCLSADSFHACITPRTKAVIPVDLYGNIPDMAAIREVARQHEIAVIEDVAEAIGSEFKGRRAGALGDVGVFSCHESRTLTTGEGGMLVTDSQDIVNRVRILKDHGRHPGDKQFWNVEIAYKYKMKSTQPALVLARLERRDELVDRVVLNSEVPNTISSYWMVTAVAQNPNAMYKEDLMAALGKHEIDSRPFFYPLSSLPANRDFLSALVTASRNQASYDISPFGVHSPCGYHVTEEQVALVCDALKETLTL